MSNTFRQDASELSEILFEGHLGASADAKLVAEAILLGFAFHADRARSQLSEGMKSESIGAVLENILSAIDNQRSDR